MWNSTPREQRGKRYEINESDALPAGEGARAVVSEDGLITVSAMQNVALVFLGMTQVRERQAEIIEGKLAQVVDKAKGRVAVSMAEVVTLTSSGINAFVALHARCTALGGHLALFALSKDLRRMLGVTKLDRAFVVADNAQEAVGSFSGAKRRGLLSAFGWGRAREDAA